MSRGAIVLAISLILHAALSYWEDAHPPDERTADYLGTAHVFLILMYPMYVVVHYLFDRVCPPTPDEGAAPDPAPCPPSPPTSAPEEPEPEPEKPRPRRSARRAAAPGSSPRTKRGRKVSFEDGSG